MPVLDGISFYWVGAYAAALCGLALLWWALRSDRARGRRRCCKCWYSMEHAPSLRCPECGHEPKNERGLYRTRIRWRWVAASLMPLLLATYLGLQPKVREDGWGSVMPATVLIALLRIDDWQWVIDGIEHHVDDANPGFVLDGETFHPTNEQLWRWQWRMLARSVLIRLEDEARASHRRRYHILLRVSADSVGDPALRQRCMAALARELTHPDGQVRFYAALYSIDYQDLDGSISRAVGLLDHEDPQTRIAGVTSLWHLSWSTRKVVPALIDAFQHDDPKVRRHALSAIGSVTKHHGPVPEAFDPVHAMEHDEDGDVRYQRIVTLAALQSDDDAWQTIEAALDHDDPHVRRGGLVAAMERDSLPPAVSTRIIECLGDPDASVREAAGWAWPSIDADVLKEHADLLESFLSHDDPDAREAAFRALKTFDDAE